MDTVLLGEALPRLWVGSVWSVKELQKSTASWTVISLLASETAVKFARDVLEQTKTQHNNIARHEIWEIKDRSKSTFICDRLEEILQAIDASISIDTGECLVHCARGVSRSVAVIAAWLISRKQFTLADSLTLIRKARPEASPNLGFIASLRALEKSNGCVVQAEARMKARNKAA
jgi:protein-tyrosine phosphatase